MSLARGDEVPQIFTRKPRLRPPEVLTLSGKRLLQHNRPVADLSRKRRIEGTISPLGGTVLFDWRSEGLICEVALPT